LDKENLVGRKDNLKMDLLYQLGKTRLKIKLITDVENNAHSQLF